MTEASEFESLKKAHPTERGLQRRESNSEFACSRFVFASRRSEVGGRIRGPASRLPILL
jgi:hypothetical protein